MTKPMRRNPIRRIGHPPNRDFARVPNALLRNGVAEMGADGFAVLLLLLSHKDGFETSAVEIGNQMCWGKNQRRARMALDALVRARRLVIREHLRDGGGCVRREYIVHADARRLTDEEVTRWSVPIIVAGSTRVNQNG